MTREYQQTFENHLYLNRVASSTREAYLRSVDQVSSFHGLPAQDLTNDQVQQFLLHCIQEKKLAWSSCNVLFCGLKKYYIHFLGRKEAEFFIPPRKR